MRGARGGLLFLLIALFPVEVQAHIHKASAFGGGSLDLGSALGGFEASGELMIPRPDKPDLSDYSRTSQFSIFLDAGANWGLHEGADRTQVALMLGFRFTLPLVKIDRKVQPFAHVVLGLAHTQDNGVGADSAGGPGAGVGVSIRVRDGERNEVFWRTQFDYVWLIWSDRIASHYQRLSTGLEFRWGEYKRHR